tara:strand:+ start:203 stop:568 length:366 start_codon:yes stop_codon:yes gene_type:complete
MGSFKEISEGLRIKAVKKSIIQLLKDKSNKMPISDIDAYLKHRNLDEIKKLCEELYNDGHISFAGSGRYFILNEEKAKAKPKATSKTKPDYLNDISVLVDLLEDDTLTKEVFIKKIREKLK